METSFSITLPKGWLPGPTEKLRGLFIEQFNKKHTDALQMTKENCQLVKKNGDSLPDDVPIEQQVKEGEEIFLKRLTGKPVVTKSNASSNSNVTSGTDTSTTANLPSTANNSTPNVSHPTGSVSCKRFGCGKRFIPGQPSAEPCRHHKKPPVFHETRKYWACCPEKVAWDWDAFQQIAGCEVLPEHTDVADASKRVMGGTEVRAEIQGPREIATEKKVTSLDKLMTLRSTLVNIGVKGESFDRARDAVKRVHEDAEGKNVWDKVCVELSSIFEDVLAKTAENYN